MPKVKRKSSEARRREYRDKRQQQQSTVCVNDSLPVHTTQQLIQENPGVLHEFSFHGWSSSDVLDGELSIQSMDYISVLLKAQYKQAHGCLPPSFLQGKYLAGESLQPRHQVPRNVNSVQIHYTGSHYIVSAQRDGVITIYDSLHSDNRINEILPQLRLVYNLLRTPGPPPRIGYITPQSQGATVLCGLFAAANALMLVENKKPTNYFLDTSSMRVHLYGCLCEAKLLLFPHVPMTARYRHKRAGNHQAVVTETVTSADACSLRQYLEDQAQKEKDRQNFTFGNCAQPIRYKSDDSTYVSDSLSTNRTTLSKKDRERIRYHTSDYGKSKRLKQREIYNSESVVREKRKANSRKQYTDPKISEKKKAALRHRYTDPIIHEKKKAASRHRYTDPIIREKSKAVSHQRYTDPIIREKSKAVSRHRYTDPIIREKSKAVSHQRYTDPIIREKSKAVSHQRYTDPIIREKSKAVSHQRYTDPIIREKSKAVSRQRYTDPIIREKSKAVSHQRYTDPIIREKSKAVSRQRYTDPIIREKKKTTSRQRYTDPIVREKRKTTSHQRYADPIIREKKKTSSRERYADVGKRVQIKSQALARYVTLRDLLRRQAKSRYYIPLVKEKMKKRTQERYQIPAERKAALAAKKQRYRIAAIRKAALAANKQRYQIPAVRNAVLAANKRRRLDKQYGNIEQAIDAFKKSCDQTPNYTCLVCNCMRFKSQVLRYDKTRYERKGDLQGEAAHSCSVVLQVPGDTQWVCCYCDRYLKKGKVPSTAAVNSMSTASMPEDLKDLNSLEQHLISPVIPFMKIVCLPKGSQRGIHGPIVCVPADIPSTSRTLPRMENDNALIRIKLKRKLQYKGHHLYQQVRMDKVNAALLHLKSKHPAFADVEIDAVDSDTIDDIISKDQHEDISPELDPLVEASNSELPAENLPADVDLITVGADETDASADACVPNTNNDLIEELHTLLSSEAQKSQEVEEEVTQTSAPLVTCLQPTDFAQHVGDRHEDSVFCVAPGEGKTPISLFGRETDAFPYLFPDGMNAFTQYRQSKIGFSQYIKTRLLSADTKFAQNPQYIFYLQYHKEFKEILQSASISMRKGSGNHSGNKSVTADQICEANNFQRLSRNNEGYKYLKSVRGSAPYWERCMRDLCAMVRQLGIPTWFASFSAADRRWPEIIQAIFGQQGMPIPEDLDWTKHCEAINSNPVTAAVMFDQRVKNFFRELVMSSANPIGKVKDYFVRVEFQQRGWPHIHCLFWVDGAPQIDRESDDTVTVFIDRYISSRRPSAEEDKELGDIVGDVQMHSKRHSKSCKKGNKKCRFNFPRPPSCRTFICRPKSCPEEDDKVEWTKHANSIIEAVWEKLDEVSDSVDITSEQLFQKANVSQADFEHAMCALASKTTIILQRTPQDCWVNQYNPALLKAWNANIDLQFVCDAYSCIRYIVSYISKKESEEGQLLKSAQQEAREGNADVAAELRQLGKVYLTHREISLMEAIYRALGMHLKDCSRDVIWVPTDPAGTRLSLPITILKKLNPKSENIWATSLLDRYRARPDSRAIFVDMCFAEFSSSYRVVSSGGKADAEEEAENPDDGSSDESVTSFALKNNLGFISQRKPGREAVIRFPKFSIGKDRERHFLNLLVLYLPHKKDAFKPDVFETYEDYYRQGTYQSSTQGEVPIEELIQENRSRFERNAQRIDDAWEELQNNPDNPDAWADLAPVAEQERMDADMPPQEDQEHVDVDDMPDLDQIAPSAQDSAGTSTGTVIERRPFSISQTAAHTLMRQMNIQQRKLFMYLRSWCTAKAHGETVEPFHIFLTGGAGTGKSHVTKALHYEAVKTLMKTVSNPEQITVLLVAPTGTAAFNVGGQTIHSAFVLPASGLQEKYIPLGEDQLSTLRAKYEHLQLVIIDEISMVSKRMLNYISGRLDQIKRNSGSAWFGGISILAVGDFFQVPPVGGKLLVRPNDNGFAEPWELFQKWSLTEIMRQKEDKLFAELLNRLRTRIPDTVLSDHDKGMLQGRVTGNPPEHALHIFAFRKSAHKHNEQMTKLLTTPKRTVIAVDIVNARSGETKKRATPVPVQNTNLPEKITLAQGSRVMVTSNIDVNDGLVNGVMGTVTSIVEGNKPLGLPQAVYILFDNENVGAARRSQKPVPAGSDPMCVIIEPHTEPLKHKGQKYTRHQLPLRLSWGCTIHKVQGMTVPEIVVSLKGIFKAGMGYVALSRVTSLNGLHLMDFEDKLIYCDRGVQSHVEAMPELMLHDVLPLLGLSSNSVVTVFHNIQCLPSKFQDILCNPEMLCADILALSETWLSDEPCNLNIPGFSLAVANRVSRQRGGVALYIREQLITQIIRPRIEGIEVLAATIPDLNMTVCVLYRPPSLSKHVFMMKLDDLVGQLPVNSHLILGGDFNENIIEDPTQNCFNLPYPQLITRPTTVYNSLLDHLYVINKPSVCESGVLRSYYSDHYPVYYKFTP